MCDHKNSRCIETSGQFYRFKCFEPSCGFEWTFEKKKKVEPKKSFLIKIKTLFGKH